MKKFWKANNLSGSPKEQTLKKFLFAGLLINLVLICFAFLARPYLPPQIPLYYGVAEAEGIIAPSWALVVPSLVSLGILGVNFFLSILTQDEFLKKTLLFSTFAAYLFAIITILKILVLVGNF